MTEWDGVRYRQVNSLQQWLADRALAYLPVDGVRRLLDVGCGDGRVTAQIAERVPDADVVGVDPSPGMIAVTPTGPRLRFEVGDVLTMAYESLFDVVVSFNALHWVRDQPAALGRIADALRRPGSALLVLVCAGPRPSLEQVAMTVTGRAPWARYFDGFLAPFVQRDPLVWQQQAARAGLRTTEQDIADLDWDFGTAAAFTAWCTVGFGAWTSHLPDDAVGDFMHDVVSAYQAATGSAQVFRFLQLRSQLSIEHG